MREIMIERKIIRTNSFRLGKVDYIKNFQFKPKIKYIMTFEVFALI